MKVQIEDIFSGIGLADYEALYFDEAFNEAVGHALQLGRRLLRLDRTADQIVRHVSYEPNRDPSSPAGQALGTSRAGFIEELAYDLRTQRGEWRTIPNQHPDRVRNAGTLELVAAPGGVRRTVRAEVRVSAFGFGRIVERMIITAIEKSYANTTEFTRAWLARRPS